MIRNWIKLCLESELESGKLYPFFAGGKEIGLLKKDGKVFAFSGRCPHAGVMLCDGYVDARGLIVCPEHHYRFNPANGYNASGEGYQLFTYAVEIREGEVYVGTKF